MSWVQSPMQQQPRCTHLIVGLRIGGAVAVGPLPGDALAVPREACRGGGVCKGGWWWWCVHGGMRAREGTPTGPMLGAKADSKQAPVGQTGTPALPEAGS